MSDATAEKSRDELIPFPVGAAAITSFSMLWVTSGLYRSPNPSRMLLLPLLGTLLLVTYATRRRLPTSRWVGYTLRIFLFAGIVLILGIPQENTSFWYFKQEYTQLGGCLLAAEMVVQAWRWRDWSQPPEAVGVAILLTALIVAAASNTFQHNEVAYFVPAYVVLLIISLRRVSEIGKQPRRLAGLMILRALLVLLSLAMGYASVLAINRYENRIIRFAMRYLNRPELHAEIGLSDAPYLGNVFNPEASLDRMLIIEGPISDPHLRVMAFDRYEAHVWRPMLRERDFIPIDSSVLAGSNAGPRATVISLTDIAGLLAAPLDSAGIDCDAPVDHDSLAVLQVHDLTEDLRYQIVNPPRSGYQGPLCAAPTTEQQDTLLTIPENLDPRVSRLAIEVAGSGSDVSRLSRIRDELREHHAYSLSFTPQGEPLSDFILNHRAAHCEYFASAMVVMARAAGIPARFVSGYYAHEREQNHFVVRGRDAHAWAECWIDHAGWITVDATPSGGTPDQLYPQPPGWRLWWDWICDLPRLIRKKFATINRRTVLVIAAAAVMTALLSALLRYLLDRRRQVQQRWRSYSLPSPDLAAAALRFEQAVRRQGLNLLPHRTWRESLAAAGPPYHDFIAEYEMLRFGSYGDPRRLTSLLDQIESESRKPTP